MQGTTYPRVLPVGEAAFTVEFGDAVTRDLNRQVHALDARLQADEVKGIIETVPTYRSLLVIFDPLYTEADRLERRLLSWATQVRAMAPEVDHTASTGRLSTGRLVEIPLRYGGETGPDLDSVAAHSGMERDAVIHLHASVTYDVAMLGFAPGFTYLLGLPPALATPRLGTPRLHVPAGSVGIAGHQTGIYALETPGGWRIIGRTELSLFDPHREDPFLVKAGDRIRFIPA